jgi:hypothetical protein
MGWWVCSFRTVKHYCQKYQNRLKKWSMRVNLVRRLIPFHSSRNTLSKIYQTTRMASSSSLASTLTPPPGFRLLSEGTASILYQGDESLGDKGEPVFYNKVQVLNRDLSIRVISQFVRERAREHANPKGNRAKRRAAFADAKEGEEESEESVKPISSMTTEELDQKLREEAPTKGITILDALAATGLRSEMIFFFLAFFF